MAVSFSSYLFIYLSTLLLLNLVCLYVWRECLRISQVVFFGWLAGWQIFDVGQVRYV